MQNTAKTPYEIRLDLLQLAFDILHGRAVTEAEQKDTEDGKRAVVISPTTADVIAEAEKLNEFISTSSATKPK